MTCTLSTGRRSSSAAAVLGAVVVLGGASGCFKSPDVSHLECLDTAHCPSGYTCVTAPSETWGVCSKGATSLDAAFNDLSPPVDALAAWDGQRLDATDSTPPDATADPSDAPSSSLDGPSAAVEAGGALDVPVDVAETGGSGPDAQPGLSGKARGATCTTHTECADGFCADGYCCDSACTGTCQACDITAGRCTPLEANATPRPGHGACAATDPTCAGKCDGTSGACAYPTVSCGTASCAGTTYTPAGACAAGACKVPPSQTCPTNQTCSGSVCACVSPKLSCSGACIDPLGDPKNCGDCGHDCQGGACLQGRCQPVVIAGNLSTGAQVFGVDSQYVYYWFHETAPNACDAYRIAKTAVNGTGTFLVDYSVPPQGVIGETIFFGRDPFGFQSSCDLTSCSSTLAELPLSNAHFVDFRSPAPQSFAQTVSDPTLAITWYIPTSNTVVGSTYTDTAPPIYYADDGFFGYGEMVYWIRDILTAEGGLTDRVLYALDANTKARSQLAAGMASTVQIADANAISVLLRDTSNGDLYRVALPFGSGSLAPPPRLLSAASVQSVTEAETGVYWADTTGTIYRCAASDCAGTKTILTNGQTTYLLYQDDAFLYWGTSSPNQIVRLVK